MEATSPQAVLGTQIRRQWTLLNGWIAGARALPSRAVAAYVEKRSEPRWLATGKVEFGYVDAEGHVLRGSGRMVDRSNSGMRFWTRAQLPVGSEFLLWDTRRIEHAATVVWTKPKSDGFLVGAQVIPVKQAS